MFRPSKRIGWTVAVAILLVLAVLAAVSASRSSVRVFFTDADTIREPLASARPRDILWQPPVLLPAGLNSPQDDYEPRFTPDGRTLVFVRGKPGENADLYQVARKLDGWTDPVPLLDINTEADELGAEVSADGRVLFFYSNRAGGRGGYDLWSARCGVEGWQPPVNLGPAINTEFNEYGATLTPDGRTLYFASNRPLPGQTDLPTADAWSATLREEFRRRPYDLYAATVTEDGFADVRPLVMLNTPSNEGSPAVSPVGDFLYFASDRPGGMGGFDVYRSRLLRGVAQPPEPLDRTINGPSNELDPALTLGGFALAFSSDRPLEGQTPDPAQDYNLYTTTSREVFRESERLERPFPWAAIWNALWPDLLWALLALALLLLLLKGLKEARDRRLSLLLRCLLLSLFAHLLIFMLMTFWEVTTTLASVARGTGAIQVALTPAFGADAFAAQIRGELTDVAPPQTLTVDAARSPADPALAPADASIHTVAPPAELPAERMDVAAPIADAATSSVPQPISLDPREPDAADAAEPDVASPPTSAPLAAAEPRPPMPSDRSDKLARTSAPANAVQVDTQVLVRPDAADVTDALASQSLARAELHDTSPAAERMEVDRHLPQQAPAEPTVLDVRAPRVFPAAPSAHPESSPEVKAVSARAERTSASVAGRPDVPTQPVILPSDPVADLHASHSSQAAAVIPRDASVAQPSQPVTMIMPEERAELFAVPALAPEPASSLNVAEKPVSPPAAMPGSSRTHTAPMPVRVPLALPPPTPETTAATKLPADSLVSPPTVSDVRTSLRPPSPSLTLSVDPPLEAASLQVRVPAAEARVALAAREAASSPPPAAASAVARRAAPTLSDSRQTLIELAPPAAADVTLEPMRLTGPSTARTLTAPPAAPDPSLVATPRDVPPADPLNVAIPPGDGPVDLPQISDKATDPIGRIQGKATDAVTGRPLPGVTVQLDVAEGTSLLAQTNDEGRYAMDIPRMPDQFAISASKDGYVPSSQNVPIRRLRRGVLAVDFVLEPITQNVLAMDATPDVHHLGNNRFEGAINSQFQKQAEGEAFVAQFVLSAAQLPAEPAIAELRLLDKGVQCPPRIEINGGRLRYDFEESPADGGFGTRSIRFDAALLTEGTNTIEIRTTACRGDLDDFEFVNVQVRLHTSS